MELHTNHQQGKGEIRLATGESALDRSSDLIERSTSNERAQEQHAHARDTVATSTVMDHTRLFCSIHTPYLWPPARLRCEQNLASVERTASADKHTCRSSSKCSARLCRDQHRACLKNHYCDECMISSGSKRLADSNRAAEQHRSTER